MSSEKLIDYFKNLGDMIDSNFIERHAVTPNEKRYFIFFKGKLYKFKSFDNSENTCQALNIKYCNIEMISIQKPN